MKTVDYFYRAFGLTVRSRIPLPELQPAEDSSSPDVSITLGGVPKDLANPRFTGVRYQANEGTLILHVDRIARFLITAGNSILVEPSSNAAERDVRLFLLGSVFGALLHQRGMLPLHASAIGLKNACVIFCGASGNGKSTTAHALQKRGYTFHSDDLCVVGGIEGNGQHAPTIYPGYPQMKLWRDTLERAGADTSSYQRVRGVLEKFAIPVHRFNSQALPLKKIYVLVPWHKKEIVINEVRGMDKYNVLRNHTFRFHFLKGLNKKASHFGIAATLAGQVPIARVHRPRGLFLLEPLIDLLENDFTNLD